MKEIQIFVPDQALRDVNDILKKAEVGGMSHYRIHGRGSSKSEEVAVGLGTMRHLKIIQEQRSKLSLEMTKLIASFTRLQTNYVLVILLERYLC